MSTRSFPALGFDPARGNVRTVRDLATQLTDTATYAKEGYDVLASVQDKKGVWTGAAAEAFAGKLDQLPEYLDKSHNSLDQAGKALSTWGDKLDGHQQRATELEQQAKDALADAESKDTAAQAARGTASQQPDDADLRDTAVDKISAANAAWDKLDDIRRQAKDLRDMWEDDANTCADALKKAAEDAPKESFWDSLGGMFDDLGGWFKDHLGEIGDIAGIVSAVAGALAFIPVLTPIAGPIALGAGAVALAAHGADMVVNEKWDDRNAWVGLGGDVLGVIPGVGAVSRGFGAAGDVIAGADRLVDVTRVTGAAGMLNTGADAAAAGGRAFADELPRVISGMKDPSVAAQWVADRATGTGALLTPEVSTNVARALEASANVSLQVPSAAGLFDTSDATTEAKNGAGWGSLVLGGITAK
jgi:uncharacterized protein YukE